MERETGRTQRRGVVLLIVLALLALFGLIAVAFVFVSGQAQRSAASVGRIEQGSPAAGADAKKLLQQAALQVLRGPNPTTAGGTVPYDGSVMRAHSLLETMYGNDYLTGTISGGGTLANFGQLINLTVSGPTAAQLARRGGCVLTITGHDGSGTANVSIPGFGQSTRIVGVDVSTGTIQVLAFPDGSVPSPQTVGGTTYQAKFTINGAPFSGVGFGYDATNCNLDATRLLAGKPTSGKIALLPNLPLSIYSGASYNPPGGANTDYTAADYQHMILAAQIPNSNAIQTLPSFHRPALCRYWAKQIDPADTFSDIATTAQNMSNAIKRATILRPLPEDNPYFTGSNPTYNGTDTPNKYTSGFNPLWDGVSDPTTFSWDVDNDGDGVPDSIWIDLGLPVRSTSDGRLYKPLFAILCVDMDGRLNVNAHGSTQQTDTAYGTLTDAAGTSLAATEFAGGALPTNLPRGQGLGPAEISLAPLFVSSPGLYKQLLATGGTFNGVTYEGRYGSEQAPGLSGLDTLSANTWFEYGPSRGGSNYWNFTDVNNAGSYGSPPDPFGVGAVALDTAGRPIYAGCKSGSDYVGFGSNLMNNPYETNLGLSASRGLPSGTAASDNLFSPAELERVIRPYDRDAPSMPSRLAMLTALTSGSPATSVLATLANRLSVTTDSWDVPCPAVASVTANLTAAQRTTLGDRVKHVTDLLLAHGITDTAKWREILPPEMLIGLKMNLNQPLGDGKDNLSNGVVDSPSETASDQRPRLNGADQTGGSFDGISDGSSPTKALEARQREARFLYVLACLTVDLKGIKDHFGTSATYEDVARFLAQWAVNAVDFRDRDSIMTPFRFDLKFANPSADLSAGWTEPTDPKYIVWGCERPELLLSETLAFHDRRTEDTDAEKVDPLESGNTDQDGASKVDLGDTKKDHSFDQQYRPQGSLFIELFNPWTSREPMPKELCSTTSGGDLGIDLAKTTATGSWPVWRLIIVDQAYQGKDPDYYDPTDATNVPKIERAVYFVGSSATLPTDDDAKVRFRQQADNSVAPILPGRYAMVGPGDANDTTSTTYLGFYSGDNPDSLAAHPQRRIVLQPNVDPDVRQVMAYNDGTTDEANRGQPPVAIIINSPHRLSISEPNSGYSTVSADTTTAITATGKYAPAWDIPLDKSSTTGLEATVTEAVQKNGRTDNLKIVYLQRLANPLLPYNNTPSSADYNPYRTVDSMPIDLFAFNGLTLDKAKEKLCDGIQDGTAGFYARQRGQNNGSTATDPNPWTQETWGTAPTINTTTTPPVLTSTSFNIQDALSHTCGFLSDPFGAPSTTVGHIGDPSSPFPWLNWNNRPYVSPLELFQVSWLRSSQLLQQQYFNATAEAGNLYEGASKPFARLTNFFLSGKSGVDEELHRVIEYLRVPSPFTGADVWANPTMAASASGHSFHPPFNRISTYREPGRININTLYGNANGTTIPPAWQGLMAGFPAMNNATYWQNFVRSRRNDSSVNCLDMPTSADCPTEFARPFRSLAGAMVPSVTALKPKNDREINATLLREGGTDGEPLFQHVSATAYDNAARNPYFRYQSIERLSNLVTTRSNVYAVWITVGYFEVKSNIDTTAHPDGYEVGAELGMDTGDIERHRAFYMIDRTIPVGFQRGQDLNVEKAILVNRFIE